MSIILTSSEKSIFSFSDHSVKCFKKCTNKKERKDIIENWLEIASDIIKIIENARGNTLKKVNEELIKMYWDIGRFLNAESKKATFGDGYIDSLSEEIQRRFPGIKGFTRRGLYRMKKFYETYMDDKFVTTLLSQISWSNHLTIMSKAKTMEERHFYIMLCINESYSARELERQMNSGYYERYMLSHEKILPEPIQGMKENPFLDAYVMEFIDLPKAFRENDFRKALVKNMRNFILELGKDFYLEALDRQKKKAYENPSVGLILCAAKNDEVVEYAMSRTMSPMLVAEYQLQLPDKKVLEKKLQELINIPSFIE